MIRKCQTKEKDKINVLKYTLENQKQILDILGTNGELDPLNKKLNEIWIFNWCGGDILSVNDYLEHEGEFFVITSKELEQYQYTGKNTKKGFEIWEENKFHIYEFVQWTDNTEEVKEFLGESGGLEKSGRQFIVMNKYGGEVCDNGDYILKNEDNDYLVIDSKSFKKLFKKLKKES